MLTYLTPLTTHISYLNMHSTLLKLRPAAQETARALSAGRYLQSTVLSLTSTCSSALLKLNPAAQKTAKTTPGVGLAGSDLPISLSMPSSSHRCATITVGSRLGGNEADAPSPCTDTGGKNQKDYLVSACRRNPSITVRFRLGGQRS